MTDYRLPRATAPAAQIANAPSVPPTAGAGAAGAYLFGGAGWLVAVVLLVALAQAKGCTVPWPVPSAKVDRVTYVYEKDDTAIPSGVSVALDKLNRRGIMASVFEDDTVNGEGQTPAQYRVALKAAKDVGLPVAIAQAGDRVVKAVKNPREEKDVLEIAP